MCLRLEYSVKFERVLRNQSLLIFRESIQDVNDIIVRLIKPQIVWARFSLKILLLGVQRSESRNDSNACLLGFHGSQRPGIINHGPKFFEPDSRVSLLAETILEFFARLNSH